MLSLKYLLNLILLIAGFSASLVACECERQTPGKFKGFHGQLVVQSGEKTFDPVPNVTFQVVKRVKDRLELVSEITTDKDGRFAASGIPPGKYFVHVDSEGWAKMLMEIEILSGETKKKEIEIGLDFVGTCCSGWGRVRKVKS